MAKFRGIGPPKVKKGKGPLPFRYVFLLSIVMFMFSTAVGLIVVNEGIEPVLQDFANNETKRVATLAINKAVNQKVAEGLDVRELFITKENTSQEITMVNVDNAMVAKVQSETTTAVQKYLKLAEEGKIEQLEVLTEIEIEKSRDSVEQGIIREIPLGQATNMAILGNLGPKVPISFTTVGQVESDVIHKIEEFGINNFRILVLVKIEVSVQVIVPFSTKITTVKNTIPIGDVILPGKVPEFYNGSSGDGVSPSIEISP
ncbi:sporulation protein YunB [Bacillus sp. BGMRC 2118]|nr:sporulation protein YunB [Bacillus sp. BGMRC 2118]